MRSYFNELGEYIKTLLTNQEGYYCYYYGENSDFIRLNNNLIRQAGSVSQHYLDITLFKQQRHISSTIALSTIKDEDKLKINSVISNLRDDIESLPEDPHFMYAQEKNSTEQIDKNDLPDSSDTIDIILEAGKNTDLVGIYTSGGIYYGFCNSLGQSNWFETYNYNFDWSLYHKKDKAVKNGFAGFHWDNNLFNSKMNNAKYQLDMLANEPRKIKPGKYRVYLSPMALVSIIELLGWIAFGLKSNRTKTTPLIKMIEDGASLNSCVNIIENIKEGVAPNFQPEGFIKPHTVSLIKEGKYNKSLVSPRSAKEYGIDTNGADHNEIPCSIEILPGAIPSEKILNELDTGVYINNLWYLNYSDRPACRITGMTRFASFWVENGEITAPLDVMRFDETIYNILGGNLLGLTKEREFIMNPETYFKRSVDSMKLPGALIDDFTFTL